jgi:hypothetical protein
VGAVASQPADDRRRDSLGDDPMMSFRRGRTAALAAVLATGALLALAPAERAAAQQMLALPADGRIVVTGSATVSGAPDTAMVSLSVVTDADTADAALAGNSRDTAKLIDAVKAAGVGSADVQTSGFSVYPRYADRNDDDAPPRIAGYTVRNGVTVRVREVGKLGELLDAAVRAGANQIDGVSFTIDDDTILRDQAREGAVRDARRKADLYAAAANAKAGRVLAISEMSAEMAPRPMMRMAAEAAPAPPIEAGSVELSAEVTVIFSLERGGL